MKNVVITGGAGFIGSNLCLRLLKEKPKKIFLIDNLMRTQSLRNVIDDPRVEFIYGDASFFDFSELGEVSHLFHLASPKINRCVKFRLEGHQNITQSAFNTVNYCSTFGTKLFLASTASVYNNIKRLPIQEEDHCYPHTIYGAGKYYNECLIQSFDRMQGMDFTINRFFNVYGENMDSSGAYTEVIFNWLNSIRTGNKTITIQGNPDEKILDLVYVSDVVDAIVLSTFKSNKQIFNVSTETGVTLTNLVEAIEKVTDVSLKKKIVPDDRKDLELKRIGDTSKLRSLGWRQQVFLEEGLKKTWDWINSPNFK